MSDLLDELIEMSRTLGNPARDLVILGEGNTSVQADAESFWVKASGTELAKACRETFVRVGLQPILDALDGRSLTDEHVKQLLKSSTIEGDKAPSVGVYDRVLVSIGRTANGNLLDAAPRGEAGRIVLGWTR